MRVGGHHVEDLSADDAYPAGEGSFIRDGQLQHHGVIRKGGSSVVRGEHRRTVHGHMLQTLSLDPEVVEVQVVAEMPEHLRYHRVQTEGIDVVGGHVQMADQRRPRLETKCAGSRNSQIRDVGSSVQGAQVVAADRGEATAELLCGDEVAEALAIDQQSEPVAGCSATLFSAHPAGLVGLCAGFPGRRFAGLESPGNRLHQFQLAHRRPAADVQGSGQGPEFLHTQAVEDLVHDAYPDFWTGDRS